MSRLSGSSLKSCREIAALGLALAGCGPGAQELLELRAVARDAYIYGFPLVDGYRVQYAYFVDKANPEYKAKWNQLFNTARVYSPEDKAVQTPNSDTPYSFIGADLRAEPLVLTIPVIDSGRYYSVQMIDAYTHNFAYLGSRTTGNDGGTYLLAGPGWTGEKPEEVNEVIRSETDLVLVLYRTQLFGPADLENVREVQSGYAVMPLSTFLGQPAPTAAPAIEFTEPLSPEDEKTSLEFFNILNFVLQFCPTHPSETETMARFARIGVGPGQQFNLAEMSPEVQEAIRGGMADAWQAFDALQERMANGRPTSADVFGSREHLKNNYLYRMAAAARGIYGNSAAEALYPSYRADSAGVGLDGSKRYTLTFAKDQLPPVNAFWSLTMYELPASLLVANPINRYLINSPMLPALKRDADGGVTIYVQHESPGKARESNWLPAPAGPFFVALRLYWPKPEATNGAWTRPPIKVTTE